MSLIREPCRASTIEIEPVALHWLDPPEFDPCAHGGIVVRIDGVVVLDDSQEEWSLGPAAVFLLRTLSMDHLRTGAHLFPHCAHAMFPGEAGDVVTIGCPLGRDWEVRHENRDVRLTFESGDVVIRLDAWRDAVFRFSDLVAAFYAASAARRFGDRHDLAGFTAFREEWKRRRLEAQ